MSALPGCIDSRNAPILAPVELISRVCTRRSAACDRCCGTLSPMTILVLLTLRLSSALVSVLVSILVAAFPSQLDQINSQEWRPEWHQRLVTHGYEKGPHTLRSASRGKDCLST